MIPSDLQASQLGNKRMKCNNSKVILSREIDIYIARGNMLLKLLIDNDKMRQIKLRFRDANTRSSEKFLSLRKETTDEQHFFLLYYLITLLFDNHISLYY